MIDKKNVKVKKVFPLKLTLLNGTLQSRILYFAGPRYTTPAVYIVHNSSKLFWRLGLGPWL